jgi:DNA-binding NarL/FixJ family response regulator
MSDSGAAAARTYEVLVVDDTPANLRVLQAVLEPAGYAVRLADGGERALAMIAESVPDLVLLDVLMPEMDGHEVTRRLRADPATGSLPIVLITASEDERKLAALEAGADDFVLKPFDRAELLARVRSLVRVKEANDTIRRQAAELAELNRTLQDRVDAQTDEIARLTRLRRFFSPQLADAIIASGEGDLLESHRAEIAVVFCHFIGLAAFAEASEPEEVSDVIAAFRAAAGSEVHRAQATLATFTGEGLMAFLNDPIPCPDPARAAVDLALAIRDAVGDLRVDWSRRGYSLGCGIGVSWGYATVGRSGPPERWDYGPNGSVVTLAERLAEHAGHGAILLSQRAHGALGAGVDGELTPPLELRGFRDPARAFSVSALVGSGAREGLTDRETEVLRLVTDGLSNRAIGRRLYISEATAARHVANIFAKLRAHTRAEATSIALRRGLLDEAPRPD